jgi:hypothetical protein
MSNEKREERPTAQELLEMTEKHSKLTNSELQDELERQLEKLADIVQKRKQLKTERDLVSSQITNIRQELNWKPA